MENSQVSAKFRQTKIYQRSCDSQRVEDVLMHNDAGVGR